MRTFVSRLLDLVLRRPREDRLAEELQTHLDLSVEDHVNRGLPLADARSAAAKSLGGLDQIKEKYRDQRGLPFLDQFGQDVRFALRLMRKDLSFTLTIVGSLALSIGALTLAFSAVNTVVLKPLPVKDPDSVYFVQSGSPGWSYPDYVSLRERTATVLDLAGYRIAMMNAGLQPAPAILWGYLVTGNYFETLGISPAAGRFFGPDTDLRPGDSPLAVVSYETWQRRFGGRGDAIGQSMTINGLPYTVIGVTPPGFYGTEVFYRPEVWVPMMMQAQIEPGNPWLTQREASNAMVVARLKPPAVRGQAEAFLSTVVEQLDREVPNRSRPLTVRLARPGFFGDLIGGPVRAFVWGLFALGVLLMLAGCSNMAGLLLARGSDRSKEIALRAALGAGKGRIVRQLVTESLILTVFGGIGGAALAWALTRLASTQRLPTELPVQLDFTADTAILAFAFAAAVVVGVMVGIAPARGASRLNLTQSLKSGDEVPLRQRFQMREILVALQVALCVVLLQAAFLAVGGLQRASTASIGWNPDGIVTVATELGLASYTPEQADNYYRRILNDLRRLPGVVSATAANSLPLHIDQSSTTVYPIPSREPDLSERAVHYQVQPDFFGTLQIPLLYGRDFTEFDNRSAPSVALINQTLAERLFGTTNAVGRQLGEGRDRQAIQIIGVVENGKYGALAETERSAVFRPLSQRPANSSMLIVRSNGGVRTGDLSGLVRAVDPSLPIRSAATGEEITAFPLLPYRVAVGAVGLLGLICSGLLLSGLHAMLAYAVSKRTREIGIRMALGADRSSVVLALMTRVFIVLGTGVLVGAVLSAGTGPLISSMVLGVSPREPLLVVGIAVGLTLIAAASCIGPIVRALRLDPLAALRES